jgi:3-methyladenine DNA glycosylase AlkD
MRKSDLDSRRRKMRDKVAKSKQSPRPEDVAKEIKAWLEEHQDPKRAAFMRKYFKEADAADFYGISTPPVREFEKNLWDRIREAWTVDDAIRLCDLMLPDKYHEMKGLAILFLLRFQKDYRPELFRTVKGWLEKDFCNSWAAVDVLCPDALGALFRKFPKLAGEVKGWAGHRNRWVKRASAVGFVKLARRGLFLDEAYDVAGRLFGVPDDLIHKATGWLLREAGKTDPGRLEAFLLQNGPRIPRTALRYAIEKFPEAKRKRLLLATKG